MPGSRDTRNCLGTALVLQAALGTATAPSLPRRLCLQCGSNYRNVEKCRLSVGKHLSRQAPVGSCCAGIRVGARPLHPTPPAPNPHPFHGCNPLAQHSRSCPGQPLARWVINPCTDDDSLCSPVTPYALVLQERAGGGHPWEAPRAHLSWKSGGFPLISQGVRRKDRRGKEQNLRNTRGGGKNRGREEEESRARRERIIAQLI